MRIASIEIKGFRCFDESGQTIELNDFTCFIGPNASGKTAAMMALVRMFGERQIDRTVTKADFHVAPGEELRDKKERSLTVEARLEFPELKSYDKAGRNVIPEFFRQMVVDEPGGLPYCRIRLEAIWTDDGTADGDIRQRLYWVTVPVGAEESDEKKLRVESWQRARIRIVYIPAVRDAIGQVRPRSESAFGRLLRAVDWGGKKEEVEQQLRELEGLMLNLHGLQAMNNDIQKAWSELYDGPIARRVSIGAVSEEASRLLERLEVTFHPDEQGGNLDITDLSDGLRALFALAFPVGLHEVDQKLRGSAAPGFVESVLDELPILTIFAVEEPENHLSPHYLGRVVRLLQKVSLSPHAQVVLSSHSPSILRRVDPEHVRYFLGGETRPASKVLRIPLPEADDGETYKYVREAVRGYPELYFSRLVVLGEGPSEEIVFRHVFEASGDPLDVAFISVVPLGGRHVHHFWRLLDGLKIPYITVLDLDKGRKGGGEARIHTVMEELAKIYGRDVLQEVAMVKAADRDKWAEEVLRILEEYNVFFMKPLDLDWAMLQAFPDAYTGLEPPDKGPVIPEAEPERSQVLMKRVRQVLGLDDHEKIVPDYLPEQYELFAWYKYLFMDGSKPVAHMKALMRLRNEPDWIKRLPDPLPKIVGRARSLVRGDDSQP